MSDVIGGLAREQVETAIRNAAVPASPAPAHRSSSCSRKNPSPDRSWARRPSPQRVARWA